MIEILNEDCDVTLSTLDRCVDVILTSPPYNTGRELNSERARDNHEARYDIYLDNKTNDDYCDWVVKLFKNFDVILKDNGCILWNVSYCSDNSAKQNNSDLVWLTIADIIRNTPFTVADRIVWKKKLALPNNVSPNKLTRICEDVFVFCRKDELKTFFSNREVKSVSRTGQKYYVPVDTEKMDAKYGMSVNPKAEHVVKIMSKLGKNEQTYGKPYCPCLPNHTEDTVCPCRNMRIHKACRCGLYFRRDKSSDER